MSTILGVVMTEEEKERLSNFEDRLRHFLFLHDKLKQENLQLKQELQQMESAHEKLLQEYQTLEKHYNDQKSAMAISLDGSDVRQTKLRLSQLVRDVDKCIALLNE